MQSFIAAARKTEDFWSGSYLLSHLTEKTIERALEQKTYNVQLISPSITLEELQIHKADPSPVASLPNRFLLRLEASSDEEVRQFGDDLTETTKAAFHLLGKRAFYNVFPGLRDNEHMHALIEKQLNGLLEIFWAFEAWDPTTKAYNDVRKTVERRLASVKNNRIYSDEPQDGLVCTVCGMREALHEGNIDEHHRIGQMRRIIEQTWRKRAAKYQEKSEESGSWIKNNERLCAVCLTKRVAREIFYEHHVFESFPSVVDFATENNPYYAIIMMDGDDMGKWINGDDGKLLDGFDKVDERYHKEFSRRLTVFSKEKVPTIVGDKSNENGPPKKGKLVYAGGDDVLAFMKLKDLLPTVKQLRSTFSSDEVLGKKATVSMGIVIAHKKEPLQLVIQTVQQEDNENPL